jgi:outer membrane immunogenic protein
MNKRLTLVALAAVAMLGWAGSASAADMPVKAAPLPPPAPTWTGTYIGINGGYGWGTSELSTFPFTATSGQYNIQGGLAGVTYGGNWQMGHAVLGFESDLDWANINGNILTGVCGGGVCFTKNKWLSTERMRAGWDFNGWMVYGTLGAAFARVNAGQDGCAVGLCGERWRAGWTAGVGVETMFWRNWSAKLEYLHFDLGRAITSNPGTAVEALDRGDIVRAGINYHFDMFSLLGVFR